MAQERVLVVDDDDSLLNMMLLHLKRRGYDVVGASDGVQALEALQASGPGSFAVLVTDLMMPRMNGQTLLHEAHRLDPYLEGIMITAAATVESAIGVMRDESAFDYLLKPLETINELSVAVSRAADHRRLRLERETLHARVLAEAERLQALISNASDAIIAADAGGVLRIVNPAAARLVGQANLVGAEAQTQLPPLLLTLLSNWQVVGGQRPAMVEIKWPAEATQLVSLMQMPGRNGNAEGWVMTLRDITHLKQVDELKMRVLTEAANKIRFPLAQALVSMAELSQLEDLQGGRGADIVYRLVKVWGRIQEWMDDLLALGQIETGEGVRLTHVDPTAVMSEMVKGLSEGLFQGRALKLELNLAPNLPKVYVDQDLLRQLLKGLISRAVMRSGRGGVIRLLAREHQGQVWIDIQDDGPPIAEADLPHIFERAFAGAGAASENTGLELALVKTIIERLGGQVWVRGEGAVGSSIAVCLPVIPQADAG